MNIGKGPLWPPPGLEYDSEMQDFYKSEVVLLNTMDVDLCEELGLQPTVFYRWQKEFLENGAAVFQSKNRSDHPDEQKRIEFLEKKIQTTRLSLFRERRGG